MGLVGDDILSNVKLTYETLWEKENDHAKKKAFPYWEILVTRKVSFKQSHSEKGSPSEHFFDAKIWSLNLEPQNYLPTVDGQNPKQPPGMVKTL